MEQLSEILINSVAPMLGHALIVIALLAGGLALNSAMTPYDELELIKEGNVAAAISWLSIVLGLTIPLAFCLAQTSTASELIIWGSFTLLVQLLAFKICDWVLSDLLVRTERCEISAAIVLLGAKLSTALINSAMG